MFLQKGIHSGICVSYKNWVLGQEGHSSSFKIKYDNRIKGFKISFTSQEDLEKHAFCLVLDKMCFLSIIKYVPYNGNLNSSGQNIVLGVMCKFKKFTQNNLVIEIMNFNFTGIPPEVSQRRPS